MTTEPPNMVFSDLVGAGRSLAYARSKTEDDRLRERIDELASQTHETVLAAAENRGLDETEARRVWGRDYRPLGVAMTDGGSIDDRDVWIDRVDELEQLRPMLSEDQQEIFDRTLDQLRILVAEATPEKTVTNGGTS